MKQTLILILFCIVFFNQNVFPFGDKEKENELDTIHPYAIKEIVITSSTKETNSLKTLPTSASILSPSQVQGMKIISVKDLSMLIPNFFVPDYGSKMSTPVYIRGIGERSTGQSVGFYVDNMPYLDKSTFDFDFEDIQRIEVLRGPQGTLYGRNAMGGIVNIFTHSSLDLDQTKISLTGGNYGLMRANASFSKRIDEQTGMTFSGFYDGNDGYFTNQYTGKKADKLSSAGGRFRFDYDINKNWKAHYIFNYNYVDQGAFPYGVYKDGNISDPNFNDQSTYRREVVGNNLNITYQNEHILFASSTGYQYFDDNMKMDQDYSPLSIFTLNQKQMQNAFMEEMTIKSNNRKNYQWSFGIYGFIDNMKTDGPVTFGKDGISTILQPVFDGIYAKNPARNPKMTVVGDENGEMLIPGTFKTPSYGGAIFHQSTYNNLFVDGLSVTAGIRLDYEKDKLDYNTSSDMDLKVVMSSRPPMDFHLDTAIVGKTFLEFTKVLPKVALKYEFDRNHYVYASVANGYKAGGFNIQMFSDIVQGALMEKGESFGKPATTTPATPIKDIVSYKPEMSWNYEVGFKGELIKNYLYGEISGYYIDVQDIQLTQFVNSGQGRKVSNAGHAVSTGLDISLVAALFDGFTLSANYGYTHATFKDYNDSINNFAGKYVPYAPQNTFSLSAVYNKQFQNKLIDCFNIQAQYNGAGRIYWTEMNDTYQDFYGILNLRMGVRKGIFELDVWTKNTLNADYAAFYFESMKQQLAQRGKPFQFGVDLNLKF